MTRPVLLLAAAVGCFGCEETIAPDAEDARTFYATVEAQIANADDEIRSAARAVPWLDVADPPCDTAEGSGTALDARLERMRCAQQRLARTEERDRALSAFERDILPDIVRRVGALSARVSYSREGSEHLFDFGSVEPAPPVAPDGCVRAARGVAAGERRLGWGLYSAQYIDDGIPRGDDELRRGAEVAWTFHVGSAEIQVSLFFFID